MGKNPNVLAFGIIENGHSWLFSTKMGVVWPLIIDQRLVHLTPHMCSEVATQPPFFMKIAMSDLENSHERPFSIILEANTYGF